MMSRFRCPLIIASLCCVVLFWGDTLQAHEQESAKNTIVAPELFKGMKYRSVGPSRGGRSSAIAGVPEKPYTFYMGSTGGGVWKTDDAGTTWNNISDGQIKVGSIGAIAVANSDENVVFVGTGSAAPRGNISIGNGVYKSTDAGKTWKHVGLPRAGLIGRIEIHPKNPDLVYVAVLGNIFGPNPERGVYRTKDGGESWQQVLTISDKTGAVDLTMDFNNPRVLFAAMWQAERKPWTMIDGGKDGGIYKTVDGGDHWEKLKGGLPTGLLGKIGVSMSRASSDNVYAIIQAKKEADGGVYASKDAGKSWSKVNSDHKLRQRGWYYSHITADPVDKDTVYISNVQLFRSVNGGKTFDQRLRAPHGDDHGVWINPHNPQIIANCNDGGGDVSLNGGKTWSTQLNQPTAEFYRVTVDNQFPYRLYGGQQDNSAISVTSKREGGLTRFEDWYNIGGSESANVAVDPTNPDIIYATTYSGIITVMNRATGQVRAISAYPHYTEGTEQRDLKYRWQWNAPVAVSPFNPKELYHASNCVHRSTDAGQTWQIISPDLTLNIDKYQDIPGGPIQHDASGVEAYSTIFAFEIAADEEGVMWAGSDDGLIHITKDAGATWQNITPKAMPTEGTVNKIELSPHSPGRAFAAVYKYRDNDSTPYVFMTNDYGQSWKLLTDGRNGIPQGHFVRAIAEDSNRKGLLYAGTEFGMYVSFNEGKNWQPLQLNLPHTPVTDIEVHQQDLVLSTQGRSFWILDDVTPLHEMGEIKPIDNHFYQPRDAYRTSVSNCRPVFNFNLAEIDKSLKYQLQILDDKDRVVVTYSSDAEKEERKLKVKAGHNQLRWNLRYPGPKVVPDIVAMTIGPKTQGPEAVPGRYTAKLSIGDWETTHEFNLLADPRWTDVSQADFQSQFDLAVEMKEMITQSHEIIKNLRAIRKQVTMISKLTEEAGFTDVVKKAVADLDKKLTAVEDELIQNKSKSGQDAINYPRVFSNHIGRLYSAVVDAQSKPTGGILERWQDLKAEYTPIVGKYKELVAKELPAFKKVIAKEKAGGLILPYTID